MDQNLISNESILNQAQKNIATGMEVVGPAIDKLTSASLKRVLRTITHVHLAEEITNGTKMELNEAEQQLVDNIFALQEDVLGYIQITNELKAQGEGNE